LFTQTNNLYSEFSVYEDLFDFLAEDTARRALLNSRFPAKFKEFEIVNAIDGRSMNALDYFELTAPLYRAEGHLLSPGEVGCALSHLEAYRRFLSTDEKMALFIEDDVEGCDEDIARIMRVAGQLNDEFLLCCGAQDGLRSRKWLIGKPRQSCDEGVFVVNGHCYRQMWRTACYVLSRGMAVSLLARQTDRLCKADDWAALLKYSKGDVLFF
jgi:Glycosyltransferase involved in LPS biosynthesis